LTLINQIDLCQQIIHEQFPKVIISPRETGNGPDPATPLRQAQTLPRPQTVQLRDGKRKRHVN